MSTTPPIQYSGPAISPEVPWTTRVHLQAIYQKLGNHTQAFSLLQRAASKAGSTTTSSGSSAGSSSSSTSQDITNAVNAAVSQALATIPTGVAVNNQVGNTSYSTQNGDNEALVVFSSSSVMAVTLPNQQPPWGAFLANLGAGGAGTVTVTPASGTISYAGNPSAASMPIAPGEAALVAFDGTNWQAMLIASAGGSGGVTSLDGISGAITLVAGANITITDNSPSAGDITIAASGGGGGYLKGNITVTPSGPGTYQGSGTITGATVGSAVLVGVTNSTEASEVSNLLGWVTSTNNVTIQATFSSGVLGLNLPVVVFI